MRIGSLTGSTMKCQGKVEDTATMSSSAPYTKDDDLLDMDHKPSWSCRIYLVVILFSLSATLGLEALWVTSPVASRHLPEGHRTSAYLVIFVLVGNVGSLAYLIARKCAGGAHVAVAYDVVPIYACLLLGLLSSGLLALFWDEQEALRRGEYHVVYLGAALSMAFVGCLSTVTYVPFVTRMKAEYVTAVLVGEALAGLIPHLVALGQGIGEPPECRPERPVNRTWSISGWRARFRPTTTLAPIVPPPLRFNESIYFFTMTGVLCVAGFCFLVLRCIPSVRAQYDPPPDGATCNDPPQRGEQLYKGGRHRLGGIEDDNVELLNAHHAEHSSMAAPPSSTYQVVTGHPVILDDGSIRHATPVRGVHTTPGYRPTEGPGGGYTNRFVDTMPAPGAAPGTAHHHHPYTGIFPLSGQHADGARAAIAGARYSEGGMPSSRVHSPYMPASRGSKKRSLTPFKPPNMCLMLIFAFWACLVINGPLSSTKAHACLPLGNRAFQSGTLMTKVAAIVAIIATCKVNPYSRVTMAVAFTSLGTIVLTYFVALISFSHESESKEDSPIFMNTGELLSTIAWASVTGLFFFTKSMVAILLRQHRRELLVWYAAVSQLGATLGALFMLDGDISICRIYRDFEKLYCKSSNSS